MPTKRSRQAESVQPEADGSPQITTHHDLFYYAGCSRDPIHDILKPSSPSQPSPYPTPGKTPAKKTKKQLPDEAESDDEGDVELDRPSFPSSSKAGGPPRLVPPTSKPPQRSVLSLYSITQGKLAINIVSGKKNVRKLEEVLYPGAIVTFNLPRPPLTSSSHPLRRQPSFDLPSFIQTLIPAPSEEDLSLSPSSSSSSSSSSISSSSIFHSNFDPPPFANPTARTTTSASTASTVLATLEFPKDVDVRPAVLNERDERARGFREVVEARICIHEEIEKGMEGFGSDDEDSLIERR